MNMLNSYIDNVSGKIESIKRNRESKVEKQVVEIVTELVAANEPTTIKTICERLDKPPQQIHQLVKKSDVLSKIKIKGRTLIVTSDMDQDTGTEEETN